MKKFITILIISCLIVLSCIAAVSAEDTSNIAVADVENSNDMNVNIIEDNAAPTGDDGSYQALCDKIYSGVPEITLENNYTFGEEALEGIKIANDLIINGNGFTIDANNHCSIFTIAKGFTLTLNNITFINGNANEGGAIFNDGNLNVTNCTFKNNTAIYGGAIYNNGNLNVYNSTFYKNIAYNEENEYKGGSIYNAGSLTIRNSTFSRNELTDSEEPENCFSKKATASTDEKMAGDDAIGTAIFNEGGKHLYIYDSTFCGYKNSAIYNVGYLNIFNSTFYNNTATYGGAIYNDGNLNVTNCTFYNNTATYGGAIHNLRELNIYNSTFYNNIATEGGAIYCINSLRVYNSTFDGNSAISASKSDKAYGGAVYCYKIICHNCTFKGNYVQSKSIFHGSFGGAIAIMTSDYFFIRNCYFIDNKAIGKLWNGKGGAIYVDDKSSTLDLTNNYFKGNTATVKKGSNVYCKGKTVSSTNNYCDASDKVKYFYQGKAFHHKVTDGIISDYSKWKAALEESSPSENNANNKVNDLPKINTGNVVKSIFPTTFTFSSISNMLVQSFAKLTNLVKLFI